MTQDTPEVKRPTPGKLLVVFYLKYLDSSFEWAQEVDRLPERNDFVTFYDLEKLYGLLQTGSGKNAMILCRRQGYDFAADKTTFRVFERHYITDLDCYAVGLMHEHDTSPNAMMDSVAKALDIPKRQRKKVKAKKQPSGKNRGSGWM